jgi:transglutaminase-like putative cysteine protease
MPAFRLSQAFRGFRVRTWINEEGDTLKEESPMGFMLVREGKEAAITKNWSSDGPDITVASAVPANPRITKENPSYLKVRLKGIDLSQFSVSGGRQKATGDVLEVRQEDSGRMKSYILPYSGEDLAPYMSDTLLIQSRSPKIINQARDVLGAEKDALRAVRRIGTWMENSIEKKPTMSLPSALEVLETKVGDCNEHTILFAALARSVGIPTRVVAGIVYFEGSFFYHAWNEVYLGEWVAYDPLINELPADATHIKLVEGGLDKQLDILSVVGLLSIDVLEYG